MSVSKNPAIDAALECASRIDVINGPLSIISTIGRGWWFDLAIDGVPFPFPTLDDMCAYAAIRARYFTPEDRRRLAGELEALRDEIQRALPHAEFPEEGERALAALRSNNARN